MFAAWAAHTASLLRIDDNAEFRWYRSCKNNGRSAFQSQHCHSWAFPPLPQDGPILRGASGFFSSTIHGFDRRLRIDDLLFSGTLTGLFHLCFLLYIFKSDGRVFRILANSICRELNFGVLRPVLMLYFGSLFRLPLIRRSRCSL